MIRIDFHQLLMLRIDLPVILKLTEATHCVLTNHTSTSRKVLNANQLKLSTLRSILPNTEHYATDTNLH